MSSTCQHAQAAGAKGQADSLLRGLQHANAQDQEPISEGNQSCSDPYVGGLGARMDAPEGVDPIEWVLYTSLPVANLEDAMVIVRYYEKRWLIEEWHKVLKTGLRVEDRQLKTSKRLEAMMGLMSVAAVRLFQLKGRSADRFAEQPGRTGGPAEVRSRTEGGAEGWILDSVDRRSVLP